MLHVWVVENVKRCWMWNRIPLHKIMSLRCKSRVLALRMIIELPFARSVGHYFIDLITSCVLDARGL
jgi:hypothetical protein